MSKIKKCFSKSQDQEQRDKIFHFPSPLIIIFFKSCKNYYNHDLRYVCQHNCCTWSSHSIHGRPTLPFSCILVSKFFLVFFHRSSDVCTYVTQLDQLAFANDDDDSIGFIFNYVSCYVHFCGPSGGSAISFFPRKVVLKELYTLPAFPILWFISLSIFPVSSAIAPK